MLEALEMPQERARRKRIVADSVSLSLFFWWADASYHERDMVGVTWWQLAFSGLRMDEQERDQIKNACALRKEAF